MDLRKTIKVKCTCVEGCNIATQSIGITVLPGEVICSQIVSRLRAAGCVFAEEETRLLISASQTPYELSEMVNRREAGLPLEHVIGWAEFFGIRIEVDSGVFIPRRRTEFLVHHATKFAREGAVVIDLCCGTGAVGKALTTVLGGIELYATDIDASAVICARRNLNSLCGNVYQGYLYDPLPIELMGRVDLIVANAPYVPTDAIELLPQEARKHEARIALDGGVDGLNIQRKVAASAPLWLVSGGHLLVETSERQTLQTVEIFARYGLIPQVVKSDELDATVVIGTNPIKMG